jgi:polar amino acid transport system substrate-binding protein
MRRLTISSLGLIAILAAACTSAGSSGSPSPAASASAAAVSTAPSVAPSATPDACASTNLTLVAPGKLTIGTDNPAYPPYFSENADGSKTAPWELGDPTNGLGFESAVAYAVAEQLGFTKEQVTWAYVPFDTSYAPGPKTFSRSAPSAPRPSTCQMATTS